MAQQDSQRLALLDFPIRPSPVEPHAVTESHPLDGTTRLDKPTKEDFFRLLIDENASTSFQRPAKRRKSGAPNSLDLPKLPAVQHGTKRLRIPPTLSGLHQPPPDAGLLPSMSTEQPLRLIEKPNTDSSGTPGKEPRRPNPHLNDESNDASVNKAKHSKSKRKHNKWSEQETADLLKGVARYGIGKWTQILNCSDYHFEDRTALDLKDRFRVCRPDDYMTSHPDGDSARKSRNGAGVTGSTSDSTKSTRGKNSSRVSSSQLQKLGIDEPFEKSKRRQRTTYTIEEDEALLQGFNKHGNSWAAIRRDHAVLKDRRTTDLRDRFRTKYPEEYAKAGLAPRPDHFPAKAPRSKTFDGSGKDDATLNAENKTEQASLRTSPKGIDAERTQVAATWTKKAPPTAVLHADDVFWGAPFEPDNTDTTPVTLDRGILDWAYDIRRSDANMDTSAKGTSIDQLATLNLPRPTATNSVPITANAAAATPSLSTTMSSANALPSLASITAVADAETFTEPLELPSLMGSFGSLETDGRTGGHFMSMEELLS